MRESRTAAPPYRLHGRSQLAVVTLDGKEIFLGPWRSRESLDRYIQVIREWQDPTAAGLSVRALGDRYRSWATTYYRRSDGTPTTEVRDIVLSLRELVVLYGDQPATTFALSSLKLVRHAMIERRLSRRVINQRIGRVKRMFRWAAAEELLPAEVAMRIDALPELRLGRSPAVDHPPRQAAPPGHVEAVLPHVAPPVRAMIGLQYLTGMRPGEAVTMRGAEIDRASDPWCYRPSSHKTAHRGHGKEIFLGPRAQAILNPFVDSRPPESFLFSPAESREWWAAKRRAERKTPLTPSQKARRPKREPKREPRDHYRVTSYDRAIEYGCRRAGVPRWTANQLRHAAATRLEGEMGLEAASATLGHRLIETTQVYAHGKRALARKVAEERG